MPSVLPSALTSTLTSALPSALTSVSTGSVALGPALPSSAAEFTTTTHAAVCSAPGANLFTASCTTLMFGDAVTTCSIDLRRYGSVRMLSYAMLMGDVVDVRCASLARLRSTAAVCAIAAPSKGSDSSLLFRGRVLLVPATPRLKPNTNADDDVKRFAIWLERVMCVFAPVSSLVISRVSAMKRFECTHVLCETPVCRTRSVMSRVVLMVKFCVHTTR